MKKVGSMEALNTAPDRPATIASLPVRQKKELSPADDPYGIGANSDDEEESAPVVLPTTTSKKSGLKKAMSSLLLRALGSPSDTPSSSPRTKTRAPEKILVVFDMDHTMVGDLVSLADRDNIETNIPWTYWPPGVNRGLSADFIIPFLQRGMLRPGLLELLAQLRTVGATIVVYTHSEEAWAKKVCEAMERLAGWKFITHLFSRKDCLKPEFSAAKSLAYVRSELRRMYNIQWPRENNTIMFDDDGNCVSRAESSRLVKVASYDYWESCQWDEVVNEEMLARNPPDLRDMARQTAVGWGVAPPSYARAAKPGEDERWAEQFRKNREIMLNYNKVASLDRVMRDVEQCFRGDLSNAQSLPKTIRKVLGKSPQPQPRTRR